MRRGRSHHRAGLPVQGPLLAGPGGPGRCRFRRYHRIHARTATPLRVENLARMSGLSLPQFDRRVKKVFQLSAGRYLLKVRIDAAARLLRASEPSIAEVAQLTGFCDQSGLSRQIRQATRLGRHQYRQLSWC